MNVRVLFSMAASKCQRHTDLQAPSFGARPVQAEQRPSDQFRAAILCPGYMYLVINCQSFVRARCIHYERRLVWVWINF